MEFLKGWDIFNVVNFKNLIYMKLYSLLILTENTKKSKNNFKALKKSEIVSNIQHFRSHIPTYQTVRSNQSPLIGVS